jgi:PAS domain S-box-containing protein
VDDSGVQKAMHSPGQLEDILAGISDGLISLDNEWRFNYVNAAAQRMLGANADAVIGKTIFASLRVEPDNPFHVGYTASKRDGEPTAFTAYSGLFSRWLEVRGYPHPDGYTIFFRDVSEVRQAYLDRLEERRQLEAAHSIKERIFETSLDLILVSDRQGNLVHVSPSSLQILGYRPDEMEGKSAINFIYQEDLENTRSEMRAARQGKRLRTFDCRYVHKDGRIVALAWTGVWAEPEQQHFFIGRDMTERIAAEERLRRSQRLEAVGQLTGGMAHDFNNLLSIVIGNLDLLQERLAGDPEAAAFAETALKASLRGADLTRQLLAFARRQSLDAKAFAIDDRVSATLDLLRRTLGEQIEITTVLSPGLWPALADPAQFESALVNLAINARDAMPGGGRLTIETSNRRLEPGDVSEQVEATPGDYVMLAVSDTGTGMAPEVLARVFEPFFTTKAVGAGTGLGLSMVYGFANQSQGYVRIYSELGVGTTVRLYLPRAMDKAQTTVEATPAALPPAGRGERILLVEDNADVRKVVARQLKELGYSVIEAANGDAAFKIIQRDDKLDLLFTDVVMPGGMSGEDLARAARDLRPGLKTLLTSGFTRSSMQTGPRPEAYRNLLSKPYRKADLAAALRAVFDSEG